MQQQQEAEPEGEEGNPCLYAEIVKGFIPKYEFEGDAAELVGQVGMQPELGVKCSCCGEPERRKTLICDACENSFHLKCLKLRLSHVLLLDHWLCIDCTSPLGERPSQPSCKYTVATGDELCKRNSPSKRRRHSHASITHQPLPQLEDKASKLRFVFKLKTSHFKGSRALANEEAHIVSGRSTDESIKEVLDSAKGPSHHMECLSLMPQQELANPSILSCQEASKDLIVAQEIHKKKAKVSDILVVFKKEVDSSKLPSCQMQSLSFDHHHNGAGLHQCENVSGELLGGVGVPEEKANTADNLASRKHTKNGLESVTHHSCLKFDDEYHEQNGDFCRSDTLSEMVKEDKFVEVQENERETDDKTAGKIDMSEKATPYNTDYPMTSFVGVDAHSKQSGYAIDYRMASFVGPDVCASRTGYTGTSEKVDREAEENKDADENRSLVCALDDAQKQHWHKDAIELMDLESSKCSKDNNVDNGEPHLQVHVKLDTTRLLQVYADCRERCIIVYHMGRGMEDHAEASQQTNVKVSDTAIERTWSLGGGFYVLLLASKEAAKEVIFNGTIPFQGGNGYAVPYVPCFSPNQEPEGACPVWVTFLHLPIYFRPFLQELASWLGKVLYVPYGEAPEASDSPRVCICWKISKCVPEFLLVDMEGLGSKKLKIEFDLSLLRRLSEFFPQKMAATLMVSSLRKDVGLENSMFKKRSVIDGCLQRQQD